MEETSLQPPELLPGTLDMLILKALSQGTKHGYGIASFLKLSSSNILHVGESSLYPALQRLLLNGNVEAEWGVSENNRRARFYTLTKSGQKLLASEKKTFDLLIGAIQQVMEPSS